jgi:hypothetical protein
LAIEKARRVNIYFVFTPDPKRSFKDVYKSVVFGTDVEVLLQDYDKGTLLYTSAAKKRAPNKI